MARRDTLREAIDESVADGQHLYLGGFTHLIPFAAGHEIIRQGVTDLTLARATPDLILDRMIAAGCASRVVFSYAGNPGVGSLRSFRRAVEDDVPAPIELEEYTHFGMVARLTAGAEGLPFMPVRTFAGTDLPAVNDRIRRIDSPYEDETVHTVPPLNPDVAVVRAQRADPDGNAHVWGIVGDVVEAAFAADTVVLSVEEVVDPSVIASDPNRTAIPGSVVDYVVEVPYGSHPSYVQGYYDRDNAAYLAWDEVSESRPSTTAWLEEWVHGVEDHREYLERLGAERLLDLQPGSRYTAPANLGRYS